MRCINTALKHLFCIEDLEVQRKMTNRESWLVESALLQHVTLGFAQPSISPRLELHSARL